MGIPLEKRDGFRAEPNHELVEALRDLRETHSIVGCVLISFTTERVGVVSSACTAEFGTAMQALGKRILTAMDDGQFDPEKLMAN
jgi:hypothetical protein